MFISRMLNLFFLKKFFIKFEQIYLHTCNKHLILSPGAIITVVKTPDNIPAANNCGKLIIHTIIDNKLTKANHTYVYSPCFPAGVCNFFPIPNPKKQIANIGVTPLNKNT